MLLDLYGSIAALKILNLLPCSTASGAGRGAVALDQALRELKVESRYLGRLDPVLPPGMVGERTPFLQEMMTRFANRLYLGNLRRRYGRPEVLFHPVSYGAAPHRHPLFDWADIIHVQWSVAAGFGTRFWRDLGRRRRPTVFTLRDQWLFTGGCHFAGNCRAYENDCRACPMLGGVAQTLTSRDLAFKARVLTDATCFVAISRRIADEARRSRVLGSADIRLIPNSVAVDAFRPIDRAEARRRLGLPADAFIAATGALYLSETRKGARVMAAAMARLGSADRLHWAVFGADPYPLPANASYFGQLANDAQMNLIYAAADVFVMPSLQESFGKTTAEALAAGTPVIAFADTPAEEIISDGESGWLVQHGDAEALATTITAAARIDCQRLVEMGRIGRRHVLRTFAPAVVARAHLALYEELVARRQPHGTA